MKDKKNTFKLLFPWQVDMTHMWSACCWCLISIKKDVRVCARKRSKHMEYLHTILVKSNWFILLINNEILERPAGATPGGRCVNKTQIYPNRHHCRSEKKELIGQSGGTWYVADVVLGVEWVWCYWCGSQWGLTHGFRTGNARGYG